MGPPNTWTDGQLKLEVASLLDLPVYLLMTPDEKRKHDLPVERREMIGFIEARREADALLLDPSAIEDRPGAA
jgi:hypothetical protein